MSEYFAGGDGLEPAESEFKLLHRIFADRLTRIEGRPTCPTASAAERTALISRFGELVRNLSGLMKLREESGDLASLDKVLARLLGIISRSVSADRSTLFLLDREAGELFSKVAEGDLEAEIRFPSDQGIAGQVFTTGRSVIIDDAYADLRFNRRVDEQTGYRTRSILCVPVISWDNQVIGVTEVLNKAEGPFDEEDRALLEALTSHAAAALESLQIQDSMQRALRDEEQMLGISAALSSELNLDTLLERIMSITTDVLDADRSTLFLHDPRNDELWSKVAEGLEVNEIRIPAGAGIAGAVFRSGDTVNIPDAYADDRFNQDVDRATGYRTRSILCAPVVTKTGRTIGVVQVLNKNGGPFGSRDEQRLFALSSQAAIALENARLFEDVLNERNYSESILRSLSNGVITLDSERRVIKVNAAAERILAAPSDRMLDVPANSLFGDANRWLVERLDKVEASRRMDLTLDADVALADGGTAHVNLTIEPLIDIKDRPIGFMLVFEDITSERRIKSTMARYMDKDLLDRVLDGRDSVLGGASQMATILFSDIRDFTRLSERLGPQDTVSVLNDYFSAMVEVVHEHRGILDKYIGDALMAVFGTPFAGPDDADDAVAAAEGMLSALDRFNEDRALRGAAPLEVRLGVNTGEVIAGNIGSEKRMDYTVIGDSVNIASRLEGINRFYGTRLLVSEATFNGLRRGRAGRELDLVRVKGREAPVLVYEVRDPGDRRGDRAWSAVVAAFETGLGRYRGRDFSAAASSFRAALDADPTDGPSRLFLNRCVRYEKSPPPPDWDGVWTQTEK